MLYEIYTEEILKVHNSYFIEANSEDEARKKFEYELDNGCSKDLPLGDIYDSELMGYEIFLVDEN